MPLGHWNLFSAICSHEGYFSAMFQTFYICSVLLFSLGCVHSCFSSIFTALLNQARIFTSMEGRDTSEVAQHKNAYSCGFSCKPSPGKFQKRFTPGFPPLCSGTWPFPRLRFSILHNSSRYFQEKEARVFFGCLAEIARSSPWISCLENVLGMMRVWDQAW